MSDQGEDFWRDLRGQHFLLVGFSELTGLSAARLFQRMGVPFKISDAAPREQLAPRLVGLNLQEDALFTGPQDPSQLEAITQILLSPGVPRSIPLLRAARERNVPIWSDFDLLYPLYEHKQIAAITGTDGKTTTTSLLAHLLRSDRRVTVAGNIGTPLTLVYDDLLASDAVVLELSSFMLEGLRRFRANVATVLNIAEDHVDRYASMDDYAEAKRNILRFARTDDVFVKNLDDERIAAWSLPGLQVRTVTRRDVRADAQWTQDTLRVAHARLATHRLALQGAHLAEDVLVATLMASALGLSPDDALSLACTFPGVPHRFEHVGRQGGVELIDDSKATSVQAVCRALESLRDRQTVLIVGGRDKHLAPNTLLAHEPHLRAVVGYGEGGQRLIAAFRDVPTFYESAFADAVRVACRKARANDVLLLSPACTSFDQHHDYRERGQVFRNLTRQYLA